MQYGAPPVLTHIKARIIPAGQKNANHGKIRRIVQSSGCRRRFLPA